MINIGGDSRKTRANILLGLVAAIFLPSLVLSSSFKTAHGQTERFFPESTKGFVTVTNLSELIRKIDETSFGKMSKDPNVKAFLDDFIKEVLNRIRKKSQVSLGIDLKELEDIISGEVAIGLIQPKPNLLGVVTIAQFTKKEDVDNVLEKLKTGLLKQKGVTLKKEIVIDGANVTHYEFPDPFGIAGPPQVFYGRNDKWVFSYYGSVIPKTEKNDHIAEVKKIISALSANKSLNKSLADHPAYKIPMERIIADGKYSEHEVRWFVDGFGFVDAAARIWPEQFSDQQIGTFKKVGFGAIKSITGIAKFSGGKRESLVRGFVYAPPVDAENRFISSAKMLDFTDKTNRLNEVPGWATQSSASYLAIHLQLLKVFDAAEDLVDELYGKETYNRALNSFKTNIRLPRNFDLRDDLMANLGNRITAVRDPKFPVEKENRRFIFAVDIEKNAADVLKTLDGYMANEDQNLVSRKIVKTDAGDSITIYIRKTEDDSETDPMDIDPLDDLDLGDDLDLEEKPKKSAGVGVIQEVGYAVQQNQILISPDVRFLEEIIQLGSQDKMPELVEQPWYKEVNSELDKIKNSTFESLRYVQRLDLPYKAAIELFKQNKGELPIEKMVKDLFKDESDKRLFDVKKLPKDFDKSIAPYLNLIGWSMTTEPDGWMLNGVLVKKPGNDTTQDKPIAGKKTTDKEKPADKKPADKKPADKKPAAKKSSSKKEKKS